MIATFLNRITVLPDVGEAYLHTIMVRYWHSDRKYDIVKEPLGKLGNISCHTSFTITINYLTVCTIA